MDHLSRPICDHARPAHVIAVIAAFAGLATIARCAPSAVADPAATPARDDASKRAAQALVDEAVALLQQRQYPAALARFLVAYERYPSPKILLNIASTLRDMGQPADAANTYQRYLDDPGTGVGRVNEVKRLLADLDQQVALLVVAVSPTGADVSIDGGAWTTIGPSLSTRVAAGAHVVRVRKAGLTPAHASVDGVAGNRHDVAIVMRAQGNAEVATAAPVPTASAPTPAGTTNGWMITGNQPRPRALAAVVPPPARTAVVEPPVEATAPPVEPATPVAEPARVETVTVLQPRESHVGLSAQARIDGHFRGAALAIGLDYDPVRSVQLELAGLVSRDDQGDIFGGYAGLRVRLIDAVIRPTIGAGVPVFWSADKARVGARTAMGLELELSSHLLLLAEVGVERFFNPQPGYAATSLVPLVGLYGRL